MEQESCKVEKTTGKTGASVDQRYNTYTHRYIYIYTSISFHFISRKPLPASHKDRTIPGTSGFGPLISCLWIHSIRLLSASSILAYSACCLATPWQLKKNLVNKTWRRNVFRACLLQVGEIGWVFDSSWEQSTLFRPKAPLLQQKGSTVHDVSAWRGLQGSCTSK